ncbi:uncharacterized protein [Amphiura filiformis]|uniref:uncharacterized protein n=1 Tax=Amphiura filiformis TaxID=82378 RepID=UPI003B225219
MVSSDSQTMKFHLHWHEGRKDFKCDLCDYATSFPSSLRVHRKKHFGKKRYQCEVCQAGFNNKHEYYVHEYTHKDTPPPKCSGCGKVFYSDWMCGSHFRSCKEWKMLPKSDAKDEEEKILRRFRDQHQYSKRRSQGIKQAKLNGAVFNEEEFEESLKKKKQRKIAKKASVKNVGKSNIKGKSGRGNPKRMQSSDVPTIKIEKIGSGYHFIQNEVEDGEDRDSRTTEREAVGKDEERTELKRRIVYQDAGTMKIEMYEEEEDSEHIKIESAGEPGLSDGNEMDDVERNHSDGDEWDDDSDWKPQSDGCDGDSDGIPNIGSDGNKRDGNRHPSCSDDEGTQRDCSQDVAPDKKNKMGRKKQELKMESIGIDESKKETMGIKVHIRKRSVIDKNKIASGENENMESPEAETTSTGFMEVSTEVRHTATYTTRYPFLQTNFTALEDEIAEKVRICMEKSYKDFCDLKPIACADKNELVVDNVIADRIRTCVRNIDQKDKQDKKRLASGTGNEISGHDERDPNKEECVKKESEKRSKNETAQSTATRTLTSDHEGTKPGEEKMKRVESKESTKAQIKNMARGNSIFESVSVSISLGDDEEIEQDLLDDNFFDEIEIQ